MSRILLVEDDPALGRSLQLTLENEHHAVTWVRDLRSAMKANVEIKVDLVLLDLGLPDGNGLDLCRHVREAGSRVPVVILTAQSHEESVLEGFSAGANDYVEKPFKPKILIARIKNALKEPVLKDEKLRFGDVLLMINQRKVFCGESEIPLNRRELDILKHLMDRAGSVVTREQLIAKLGRDGEIYDRTIDSHVSRLRTNLKNGGVREITITSVYGIGYRLDKKAP